MVQSEQAVQSLETALRRLIERCRPWPSTRWSTQAHGMPGTRADVAYSLVCELAAACPATPVGVVPPRLRDLALADQLAVIGKELIQSQPSVETAAHLEGLVRKTRDALEPAPLL